MQAFIEEAKLFNCGFFAYSKEPDTAAANMKNQVHYKTKERRVKKMYEKQSAVAQSILLSYVGKTLRVLCEGIDYERGQFYGRPYFFAPDIDGKVYFNANEAAEGEEYDVEIVSACFPDLTGRTKDYISRE